MKTMKLLSRCLAASLIILLAASPVFAYFEDPPMGFKQLTFAGAHSAVNPAFFGGTALDIAYHQAYMGIDEEFSSYHLRAAHDWRRFSLDFSMSDFSFDSVYNEHINRLALGMKLKKGWQAGLALKQFAIKFSPDSYSAGDPYLSSTDASAVDADLGVIKKTSKGDISFSISNLLAAGIGIVESEPLNRSIAAGWWRPFSLLGGRHLFFSELAVNDSDNFESFDYRFALESNLSRNMVFRIAFDRYYFVPSAEFIYPLEGKYDIGAGFAYRYPYDTFSGFTQFTTLISVRRKALPEKEPVLVAPDPEDPARARIRMGSYFNAAVQHYQQGEYKKAIEGWQKVLDLDPDHSESKRLIKQAGEKLNEQK